MKFGSYAALVTVAAVGCGGSENTRECRRSEDCSQGGIQGECLDSPESEAKWCVYPDPECASGRRFGVLAGDSLASTCVPFDDVDAGTTDAGVNDARDASGSEPDGDVSIDAGFPDAAAADAMPPAPYLVNGQAAAFVLGQADFDSVFVNPGGFGAKTITAPFTLAGDANHLWVSDSLSRRVLQWNTPTPSTFAPANVVLGQPSYTGQSVGPTRNVLSNDDIISVPFGSPPALAGVGVCKAGAKLVVPDGKNNRVMIWAAPPAANGANADLVLGAATFTTQGTLKYARRCWSNGQKLAVSYQDGPNSALVQRVAYWTTFPTANNEAPDQILTTGAITSDGTRLVAHDGNRVRLWNTWPATLNVVPDVVLGQQDLASTTCVAIGPSSMCGDGEALLADGRLFVSDPARARVLVWEPVPTVSNTAATYVIGVPNFTTDGSALPASATNLRQAKGITVVGGYLWVASENRVLAFKLGEP